MPKLNLLKIAKGIRTSAARHSPEILTGIGIAGMITSTVLAVRATPKALTLIEEEKERQNSCEECTKIDRLTPVDTLKTVWKCYIPTVATSVVSIACLIGASSVNLKRNTALATAYTLSESALKDYQEKVVETIGERKEKTIRDEVAKAQVEKNPVSNQEIIVTNKGDTLCYDVISGRYFKSDIDKLKKAENELNRRMRDEMYISVNDFYDEIGLPEIGVGDDLGWNIDRGYIDMRFSSQLAEDNTPCLVVGYHVAPKWDYQRY